MFNQMQCPTACHNEHEEPLTSGVYGGLSLNCGNVLPIEDTIHDRSKSHVGVTFNSIVSGKEISLSTGVLSCNHFSPKGTCYSYLIMM